MTKLSILGSTGSIGIQTLGVVRGLSRYGDFPVQVEVLSAKSNITLLEEQMREWKPKAAAVYDKEAAKELREKTRDLDIPVFEGPEGLCEAAVWRSSDLVLNAVVGMVGLQPTLAAIEAGKDIALANKETLVAGGSLVMEAARKKAVRILPVDSEHSAIFQCLQGRPEKKQLKRLILTASGGPFFGKSREELQKVTLRDALKHPNWSMGAKITVDSATMMNKGLEVIEAHWLFDMPPEEIDVVVHRESIVHSLIEYRDHSVIAQMGLPDMTIPIQYALTYPDRFVSPAQSLNLWEIQNLTFFKPDDENFRCLPLCREAIQTGGTAPAIINGANEAAVELFMKEKISFLDIPRLVETALRSVKAVPINSLEDVLAADAAARGFVAQSIELE